jgi:hypothetical protein
MPMDNLLPAEEVSDAAAFVKKGEQKTKKMEKYLVKCDMYKFQISKVSPFA